MAEFLFLAHSGWRYLILATGVLLLAIALVATRAGVLSNAGRSSIRLFRVYTVFLDVQLLLGVGTALVRPWLPMYIGHIVMMVAAAAVAHVFSARLRKRAPEQRSPLMILLATILSLALVVAGIMAIQRPVI